MKVILLMAQTLDGKIGRNSGHFPDWTGKEDKRLFVRITKAAGVLIMGSKTYDTIGGPLPGRKNVVLTRDESRRSDSPELVFSGKPPRVVLADLQAEGYTTVVLAGGTVVNTLFAREGLIDEIMLTICPLFFGSGIALFSGEVPLKLRLLSTEVLGSDAILAHYEVVR
ncbi:MAG TPA: dihydrofolate reductase family protein [Desulfobacterales bacterium]|jgi:dihydrofolate reductase|nr:dihydrofolate reductase family protein [Desulfobacterales bacterium]